MITAQARAMLDWKAAQGKHDWASFYRAKASGKTSAFTLEAFKAGK